MTTPDVVDQAQHAEVLRLLTRGWPLDKVPTLAHVPADVVQQLADAAGWPDLDRVRREYAAAAREIEAADRARRGRPGGLLPAAAEAVSEPQIATAPTSVPRPDPKPVPAPASPLPPEAPSVPAELPLPAGVLGDLARALAGHRWRRDVDTCHCGWAEAGASHALHIAERLQDVVDAVIEQAVHDGVAAAIEHATAPLRAELDQARAELDQLRAAAVQPEAEPVRDGPPPKPAAALCEVCGIPVSAAYIAKTGRARHGHHPDPDPDPQEDTP